MANIWKINHQVNIIEPMKTEGLILFSHMFLIFYIWAHLRILLGSQSSIILERWKWNLDMLSHSRWNGKTQRISPWMPAFRAYQPRPKTLDTPYFVTPYCCTIVNNWCYKRLIHFCKRFVRHLHRILKLWDLMNYWPKQLQIWQFETNQETH